MKMQKMADGSHSPTSEAAIEKLGKHISRSKAAALLAFTTAASLSPMLLAFRFWNSVPFLIRTGLVGTNGQDDSLPRWALFFAIPGLFCLMNLICHAQLWLNQRRMTIPKAPVRFFGRLLLPVISVLLSYYWILRAADAPSEIRGYLPLVLGLGMMLLGAHFFDCPRSARLALHFPFAERSDEAWARAHRLSAYVYLAVGVIGIAGAMLSEDFLLIASPLALIGLLAPVIYSLRTNSP